MVVEDEDMEAQKAYIVLLDAAGNLVKQQMTVIGGDE